MFWIGASQMKSRVLMDVDDECVCGVAYGMERMHAAGSNFAMALDDQDITQLMPMRGDQYEQSVRLIFTSSPPTLI